MASSPASNTRATSLHDYGKSNRHQCSNLSAFLRLPRELRDMIYGHYVRVEEGYSHNYATNKLTQYDGSLISFPVLSLTCRQIAHEMKGVALNVNKITFSPFHSEATQMEAGAFHANVKHLAIRKADLLNNLALLSLDTEIVQTVASSFPQFSSVFDCWKEYKAYPYKKWWIDSCGEAPSIWKDFISYTLELVSKHPTFLYKSKSGRVYPTNHGELALKLTDVSLTPWHPPGTEEFDRSLELADYLGVKVQCFYSQASFSYSAASVALSFLRSITKSTRAAIRKIVLLEDRQSVAAPECHGRGFIPYCQENQNLRIERFVNLWKSAFPVSKHNVHRYIRGDQSELDQGALDDDLLEDCTITKVVGAWIMEALALPSLGMPEDSFTLILDGDRIPEHTSEVFRVVQRDAAWQSTLDKCYMCGSLPKPSWLSRRVGQFYMYEELPGALQNLSMTSPLVRCNFEPGPPYDVESLLKTHRGWDLRDWQNAWRQRMPQRFDTKPPLPPWHVLRWRNAFQEDFSFVANWCYS
ncbi:Nn.00g104730.m01.CDS01 [Neocucurbitaria sp. VM-36]